MKNQILEVFTDGGSRGNPGKAACAFVVFKDGKIIAQDKKFLGISTNNVAEYTGVVFALEWLINNDNIKASDFFINFNLDSELVVKQLNGIYKIKDDKMIDLSLKVKKIINQNELKVTFKSVLRKNNELSDRLVNMALDAKI